MRCKRAIPRSMHARASRARSAYACRLCENRPGGRHSAARTPCVLVNVPACMRCAASCLATAFVLFFGTCASFEHGRVGHVADAICMPCCMHRCDRFHSVNRQKHEHTNACLRIEPFRCKHTSLCFRNAHSAQFAVQRHRFWMRFKTTSTLLTRFPIIERITCPCFRIVCRNHRFLDRVGFATGTCPPSEDPAFALHVLEQHP